ncbi:hypothetical protein glysoja_040436 [Glycine soja]|uniref:Uncharacterized protein n=1 Tax=Glycine soja TaxID=3848 RepID=A0A0B2PV10_GLYSO|nr:hypothetical protein glysoja_040436 [Glycine soja]
MMSSEAKTRVNVVLRIAYSKQQCGSFNTWDAKALIAIYSCFVFGVREFRSPYSVSNKRRARKLAEAAESSPEKECLCCWRTCHVHSASVSTHQRMLLMAMIQRTNYKLSEYTFRLSTAVNKLATHLTNVKEQIANVRDYITIQNVFERPKDIVDLLKALIYPQQKGAENPKIFEGTNLVTRGIEHVFWQKHVLLFISGLDSIEDEISLLNSTQGSREQFKALKSGIKFYAVEYFFELPGLKIIKDTERLNYEIQPIAPLFSSKGTLLNENALEVIFEWGIEAFPFRKVDGDELTLKWKWLWDLILKATPVLQMMPRRKRYLTCGRVMEVSSVKYKCCHRDDALNC